MVALLLTGEGVVSDSVAKRVASSCRIAGCNVQIFKTLSEGIEFLRNLSAEGNPADAVLIGAGLASPVAAGRKIHQIDPLVQLIFLIDESRKAQLQCELKYAPPPGGHWAQASANNSAALVKTIRDAVKVSAQRRRLKTTLDGFNTKISFPR